MANGKLIPIINNIFWKNADFKQIEKKLFYEFWSYTNHSELQKYCIHIGWILQQFGIKTILSL